MKLLWKYKFKKIISLQSHSVLQRLIIIETLKICFSIKSFFVGVISVMPLAWDDETLSIFALTPPVSSIVMFFNFLLNHPFDLGMQFLPDHHEILFRNNDLIDWEDELFSNFLINAIRPDYLICINLRKTVFVDLGVKVSINAGLEIKVQQFQSIDLLSSWDQFTHNFQFVVWVPHFGVVLKMFFSEQESVIFAFPKDTLILWRHSLVTKPNIRNHMFYRTTTFCHLCLELFI